MTNIYVGNLEFTASEDGTSFIDHNSFGHYSRPTDEWRLSRLSRIATPASRADLH